MWCRVIDESSFDIISFHIDGTFTTWRVNELHLTRNRVRFKFHRRTAILSVFTDYIHVLQSAHALGPWISYMLQKPWEAQCRAILQSWGQYICNDFCAARRLHCLVLALRDICPMLKTKRKRDGTLVSSKLVKGNGDAWQWQTSAVQLENVGMAPFTCVPASKRNTTLLLILSQVSSQRSSNCVTR